MRSAAAFLQRQFHEIQNDPVCGFSAGLVQDDLFRWRVTLLGPPKTPYERGVFPLLIEFPPDFPESPPAIRFLCPMYHPNVRESGELCLSLLTPADADGDPEEAWMSARTVASLLLFVISLLSDPNCDTPENIEAARTFMTDKMEYARKVRRIVRKTQRLADLGSAA
jgi:ubiquitin-conjugating enzyme E2 G1